MKRLFALLLVIAMIVSFQTTVFAQEQEDGKTIANEKYGYTITQQNNADGSEVRVYVNHNAGELRNALNMGRSLYGNKVEIPEDEKYEYIKSVLTDVGFATKAIASYTESDFEEYCASDFIQTTTSYYKVDDEGNQEQVLYDEIPQEVLSRANTGARGGITDDSTFYDETYFLDSYLSLRLTTNFVAMGTGDYVGESYKYTLSLSWLTTPNNFGRIGECLSLSVKESTIIPSTFYAWYSYEEHLFTNNTDYPWSPVDYEFEYNDDSIMHSSSGSWDRIGMKFDYPPDVLTIPVPDPNDNPYVPQQPSDFVEYRDFFAYMEFEAAIVTPGIAVNFNAMAVYEHINDVNILITPELSIGIKSDDIGVSIGFDMDLEFETETWLITFPNGLKYIPRQ